MPDFSPPEVFDSSGASVPKGTEKVDRPYLEIPQDEVPDPYRPGVPEKQAEHVLADIRISVVWDQRPLMEEVNAAVQAGDIQRVIKIFSECRIDARQDGPKLVRATCVPPKK